jgi:6-phosphofructokinase 1
MDAPDKEERPMKRIGVLTSGGDAPGMNAALRAVVRTATQRGHRIIAFYNGFKGLVNNESTELYSRSVGDTLTRGGTIIGTTRYDEFKDPENIKKAAHNLELLEIEGLIIIGGEGSFRGALELHKLGVKVVGVPGTIDNDCNGTDWTIGFDTAVETVLDSIRKLRDTASSHQRTIIIEVMGRHSGWIALKSGIAGGAEAIIVPEFPFDLEELSKRLESGIARGKKHSLVVLAEGVMTAAELSNELKDKDGFSANTVVLGYVQRGGSPTANDIILGSKLGSRAVDEIAADVSGVMVGEIKGQVVVTDLEEVLRERKVIDPTLFHLAMDLVH